ncbi:MAG: RNA 3'-terminal phosphate cyclase [Candidatus Woesearchaeota archaeon]|nr:RNA 3'-terminal phosphate cyclase [Candidatus Woesearchaeota archaeon]
MDMVKLDGSFGEGGGQIVRTALALSVITQKPFEIDNIRKGRCSSGLKHQHLYCVKAFEELCNAKAEGAEVGSCYLKFFPSELKPRTLSIDIETAGSITLFLQSIALPCILAKGKTRIKVKGGTDVAWSMPVDYFKEVFLPQLKRYADIEFRLERRGYYPKGNGSVDIKIKPKFIFDNRKNAPQIELIEQGHLMQIKGVSHASIDLEKSNVAERQAKSARSALLSSSLIAKADCPINIRSEYCNTLSTGSGITLWAIFSKKKDDIDFINPVIIGADSLGEKGKLAEVVGKEAAERLLNEISYNAPVDEHLADNLIPLLGLFGGKIKVAKISNHALTNIYVVEKFLDVKFEIDRENRIISCKG